MTAYIAPGIVNIDDIVSDVWYIKQEDLYRRIRYRELVEARYVAIFICVNYLGINIRQAARKYNKDHSTGHHAIKTVTNLMQTDQVYRQKLELVIRRIEDTLKLINN